MPATQSMLVSDNDEYVRSVLKRALGEDKANLLLDRILQGDDCQRHRKPEVDGPAADGRADAPRAPADRRRHPGAPGKRPRGRGAEAVQRTPAQRGAGARGHARRHPALGDARPERGAEPGAGRQRPGEEVEPGRRQARGRDHQHARRHAARPRCWTSSASSDNDLAQKILDNMFTFDDLRSWTTRASRSLLQGSVSPTRW